MANIVIDRVTKAILQPNVSGTRRLDSWHPSSASTVYKNQYDEIVVVGTCLRRQYYQKMGYDPLKPTDVRLSIKALGGDLWSEFFIEQIKRAGFWYGDEVPFYNQSLNMSGRVDVIVAEEHSGHPVGVEIKTVGTFLSKGVIRPTATMPLQPQEAHALQCMLYLYHWASLGIKKWVLLYVDRDNINMAEHVLRLKTKEYEDQKFHYLSIANEMGTIEWEHLRLEDVVKRWQELSIALKHKKVPPKDYTIQYSNPKIVTMFRRGELNKANTRKVATAMKKREVSDSDPPLLDIGDWQCRYCEMREHCYATERPTDMPPASTEQIDATL